jgi:DNA repair protein RadC
MEAASGTAHSLFVRGRRRRYEPATAEQILDAARGVVDRRMQRGMPFAEPAASCRFFLDRLSGYDREVFAAAYLDGRHRLIDYSELFFGTIDGAEVHPRELVKRALLHNAAAVIVAHNHPSGTVEPSAADRAVTARLKQALSLVDVHLLDHIIVAGQQTLTMAAKGWV